MTKLKSPLVLFFLTVILIAIVSLFGPPERSLGANVRVVYLHGAWVLTAETAFLAAGLTGLTALLARNRTKGVIERLSRWSVALGRSGTVFWITYLPLSLWAMQANWNGLFLAEPRFRVAVTFAVVAVLLQVGLWLIHRPLFTSAANLLFIIVLLITFARTPDVLHPGFSPIFDSGDAAIIGFFVVLNLLAWAAAYFLTRWFLGLATPST